MRGCVTWGCWVVVCVCAVNPGGIVGIGVVECWGIAAFGEAVPGTEPEPIGFVGSMVGLVVGEDLK